MGDAEIELSNLTALFWIRRDGLEPIGTDKGRRSGGAATAPLPPGGPVVERRSFSSRIDQAFPEPIGFCGREVPTCNDPVDGVCRLEDGH